MSVLEFIERPSYLIKLIRSTTQIKSVQ